MGFDKGGGYMQREKQNHFMFVSLQIKTFIHLILTISWV